MRLPGEVHASTESSATFSGKKAAIYGGMFLLCLLAVFRVLHWGIVLAVIILFLLLFNRRIFKKVDYSLLLDFLLLFPAGGKSRENSAVEKWISSLLQGHELWVSAAVSQVISNVPAALMLSGFTENWKGLLLERISAVWGR